MPGVTDADLTLGEVGRRLTDLEGVAGRLNETVIRMQTIAELQTRARDRLGLIYAAIAGAVAAGVVTWITSAVH